MNSLNNIATGTRNIKYTIDSRILELIHPSNSANLNHIDTIQFPIEGINKKISPRIRGEYRKNAALKKK